MNYPPTPLLFALACVACTVNPQPDPPLDIARVSFSEDRLMGTSGAVISAETGEETLWLTGLTTMDRGTSVPIAADGSFSTVWPDGVTRALVFSGADMLLAGPADFQRASDTDSAVLVDDPLPCAEVVRLHSFAAETVSSAHNETFAITNRCGDVLSVIAELRVGGEGFSLVDEAAFEVPIDASVPIAVTFAPATATRQLDELKLDMTVMDGRSADVWVTLLGDGQ